MAIHGGGTARPLLVAVAVVSYIGRILTRD